MTAATTDASALRGSVASGVRWGAFNQMVQQVTRLAVQIVLTRLLAPEAFGLLTLAFVVINLGALLTGLGFTQALIQRRELTTRLVDAAFVGSALVSLTVAVAVAAAAEPLAVLLGEPDVAPVLRVLSVVFLFQGVEGTPNGMLRRELLFRQYVLSSLIAVVLAGAVGVALALADAGVWALVGFALVEAVVATSLAWAFAIRAGVWRPRLTWDLRPLRSVLGYSAAVTANRALFYGSRNIDNLIVGRVLGAVALGIYGLAYRIMLLPIQRVTDVVASVALPAFARVQDDPERLQAGYLRAVRSLVAVIVPVTFGVALTADDLVPAVFGAQWEPAVLPLRVLALSGPALAMVRLNGQLWEAIDRAGLSLGMSALTLGALVPAFLIGVRHGVIGVAIAYTATAYLGLAPTMVLVARTAGVRVLRQLANVATVAVAIATMTVSVTFVSSAVPDALGHLVNLVAMAVVGAFAYGSTLWIVDRQLVRDTMTDLNPRSRT